jgi:hypothetical protein
MEFIMMTSLKSCRKIKSFCEWKSRNLHNNFSFISSAFTTSAKISLLMLFFSISMLHIAMFNGCAKNETNAHTEFLGRWDLTVYDTDRTFPAWLELLKEGDTYAGRYVSGKEGSARPIPNIKLVNDTLYYSLPPQYERQTVDLEFTAWINNGKLEGFTFNTQGTKINFTGVPAPALEYRDVVDWGEPVQLLREDLSNWKLRYPDSVSGWTYKDGILNNAPPSEDLISEEKFMDFKITADFRTFERSNSGIYLRGRYELQIMNNPAELTKTSVGGVYGFIQPRVKAAKEPGEWNTIEATLIGRYITIVLNGDTTAVMKEIPGITGGALNSDEGEPGPIMLQGDHEAIEYKNIVVSPAK